MPLQSVLWTSQVVLVVKNPPASVEDTREEGSIPGLGRSPGGGHGNPLQYSCPENPMDRGAGHVQSVGLQRVGHDWATELTEKFTTRCKELSLPQPLSPGVKILHNYNSCDPMNCSPPGSSVHGIFWARILKWVAIPLSRGSSLLNDQTRVSHTAGRFFTIWPTPGKPNYNSRTR